MGQESKDFDITLEPDDTVSEFEIALSVVDLDNKEEEALATKTIRWKNGWGATIVGLVDGFSFKGSDPVTFKVKNNGKID